MTADPLILVVDDDPEIGRCLQRLLRQEAYCVFAARSGAEGLSLLRQRAADVILCDLHMLDMDGVSFLDQALPLCPTAVRIILSGDLDEIRRPETMRAHGIWRCLPKPWPIGLVSGTIQEALALTRRAER